MPFILEARRLACVPFRSVPPAAPPSPWVAGDSAPASRPTWTAITVESTDLPACWAFAPTLDGALESLAQQVAPALATHPLPPLPPHSLDRRPDLRARFARVVARALGRPIDSTRA